MYQRRNKIILSSPYYANGSLESRKLGIYKSIPLIKYIYQICYCLYELHNNNIIHGNLKPSNILIDSEGDILLSDYCQYLLTSFLVDYKMQNLLFMSPELLKNDEITTKSDIWSLGCISYKLLVGYTPFEKFQTINDMITNILSGNYLKINGVNMNTVIVSDLIDEMLKVDDVERKSSNDIIKIIDKLEIDFNEKPPLELPNLIEHSLLNINDIMILLSKNKNIIQKIKNENSLIKYIIECYNSQSNIKDSLILIILLTFEDYSLKETFLHSLNFINDEQKLIIESIKPFYFWNISCIYLNVLLYIFRFSFI